MIGARAAGRPTGAASRGPAATSGDGMLRIHPLFALAKTNPLIVVVAAGVIGYFGLV